MKKKSIRKLSSQKLIASAVSAAVVVSPIGGSFVADAAGNSFKDVSTDAYYYKAVQELVQKGVVSGYPDGTFKPDKPVTRAEFSALLVKALELDTASISNPNFKDVHTNDWYYSSVAALADLGLVGGYEDGTFQPNKKITRAEIAALLTRVCNLSADNSTALPFTDVPANAWFKEVVAALYQSQLVSGKTATTFAPNDNATRAEATVFLQRADSKGLLSASTTASAKIDAVTNEAVTIDGASYQIADNLKGIFNTANSGVLKDAKISFVSSNQTITKVTYLEVTASGQASSADEEFSKNIVLDGNNNTIGKLKIAGNFVSVKNLVVTGDLEIGKELLNDFYSQNITVSGKTIINGGDSDTVVFTDATLNTVEVNKKDVRVEPKGTTTIKEVVVTSNATITADANVVLPKVTVKDGVDNLTLNVKADDVVVDTTKEMTLDASKIGTLELVKSTKITLAKGTVVENLVLPAGVVAKDIIKNYDDMKKEIAKINGKTNPDAAKGGGAGGGGAGSVTPSDDINSGKTIDSYTINIDKESAETFGPNSGKTTITGNLTITGTADEVIELRNIEVKGKLIVNIPNGTIKLDDNVIIADTDIQNVKYGTFSSAAKHKGSIVVSDKDAAIELTNTDPENKPSINITGGGKIALGGHFNGTVNIQSAVELNVEEGAAISDIAIQTESDVALNLAKGAGVSNIAIEKTANVALTASAGAAIANIAIQAANVELSVPAGVSIAKLEVEASNVKLIGTGAVDILDKVEVTGDNTVEVVVNKDELTPTQKDKLNVFEALNKLTWDKLSNEDIKKVTNNLTLKQNLEEYAGLEDYKNIGITWTSDKIDKVGNITSNTYGEVTLTATLTTEIGNTATKTFKINVDTTVDPKFEEISFGGVVSTPTPDGKVYNVDLTTVQSDIFSATVRVNNNSKLSLSINNLGSLGDIQLTGGVNQTIDTIDMSHVSATTIDLNKLDLHAIYNAYTNANVSNTEVLDALNINQMLLKIDDPEVLNQLFSVNGIHVNGLINDIQDTPVEDYINSRIPYILDALPEDAFKELVQSYKNGEELDFNKLFSDLPSYGAGTAQAVYNAIDINGLIDSLETTYNKDDFENIINTNVHPDFILQTLDENNIQGDIISVIDLPALFTALGKSEGFTKDFFSILAKVDGDNDDNVLTMGATLTNTVGSKTNDYTIKMTVGPTGGGGGAGVVGTPTPIN
ncbi:S-layer homology domain-containing protein [Schinkia sp. CFF1]